MIANAPRMVQTIQPPADAGEVLFQPFAGFQTEACAAGEDEVFLGGAKGPGKTQLLIALATRQIEFPTYKAVLCRSSYGEVQELVDRAQAMYPKMPEKPQWRGDDALRRFEFPSGAYIAFTYMETEKDAERWQGKEPNLFGWDEFGKAKNPRPYELMLGELRSKDPRVRCQAITTGNPGQRNHQYIKRRFIAPCGEQGGRVFYRFVLPNGTVTYKSRRWIPGKVWDNPIYANDPSYIAQLMSMNERDRKYLLAGSWDSPDGAAFAELDAHMHLVRPFKVPAHWPCWGSHDWGFAHPWAFCWFAADEDGNIWLVDTVWGRRQKDSLIAERIKEKVPIDRLEVIYAGSDVFAKHQARSEEADAPSTAERYLAAGLSVVPAKSERVQGASTLREMLAWRGEPELGIPDREPVLRMMDTPGNRRLFTQLDSLVTDPDDPEDVLKVDADSDGQGGDDGYDCIRYGVHSRHRAAKETWLTDRQWRINDPDVLRAEMERKRTQTFGPAATKRKSTMESYA